MLKTKKSISLLGNSVVDGVVIATFSANVYDDGTGNDSINTYINDQTLYAEHKKEVRADLAEFQNLVWDEQDKVAAETSTVESTDNADETASDAVAQAPEIKEAETTK